jgi:hypothetical protein
MSLSKELSEWWTKALIDEQTAAHPNFGENVHVNADGDVVTLTGTVKTVEDAEELEHEAQRVKTVQTVVNHLTVNGQGEAAHLQTVIAVFPDEKTARLACQSVAYQKVRTGGSPRLLVQAGEAKRYLPQLSRHAHSSPDSVRRYIELIERGKVLLIDRVPEDDALRVVSAFEGTPAELVQTLPPEPEAAEK